MKLRFLALLAATFIAALPFAWRGIQTLASEPLLILRLSLPDGSFSWNPVSPDANPITGSIAAWIIGRDNCAMLDDASVSLVGTPALHAIVGNASEPDISVRERNLGLLRICLARGLSPEIRFEGLTALHHAVLTGSSEAVALLLEADANASAPVIRPGHLSDGANAAALARMLIAADESYPRKVLEVLSDDPGSAT